MHKQGWRCSFIIVSNRRASLLPTAASIVQIQPNIKGRQIQDMAKASLASGRAGEFPALVAMGNVKFKLDITALGGNGRKHVNVVMAVNEGG